MRLKEEYERERAEGGQRAHNGSVVVDHSNIVFHDRPD
jgi:hypothetical protein